MKTALTIAGSDCSGGAGIQADLKTFSALGVFGMSVITSVVAENTVRVIDYDNMSHCIIEKQMNAVCEDIFPDAVKIGMLSTREIMTTVANCIKKWKPNNIVLDPVMYAKNGCALMDETSIDTLIKEVLPLATLVTPNIPEAEKIIGESITNQKEMENASQTIFSMTGSYTLVKGGHSEGDAVDCLFDGERISLFHSKRIDTKNTHGTGCTLSSAITAGLAKGKSVSQAVDDAKIYITGAIEHSLSLGEGYGPTNHFFAFNFKE